MFNSLEKAVNFSNTTEAKTYLDTNLNSLIENTIEGSKFLMGAIKSLNYEVIQHAISSGLSLEWRVQKQISPLLYSCRFANLEMVKYLVSKESNIHDIDVNGDTVFHYALSNKNTLEGSSIAKYFIELGLNPYNKNFVGRNIQYDYSERFPTLMLYIRQNSSFVKEDITIKEALISRDFNLAYQIANLNLSKMGTIIPTELNTNYQKVFNQLMMTALYSDRIEEFKQFSTLLLQITPEEHHFYGIVSFYSALVDMSEQNLESAVLKIDNYVKTTKGDKFDEAFALIMQFYLYSKLGNNKELNKIKRKFKNRLEYFIRRDGFLKYLYPLLVTDFGDLGHENALFSIIQELDVMVRNSSLESPAASRDRVYMCTLGALYFDLKGDNENRELLLEFGDLESKKNFHNMISITNYALKRAYF